MFVFSGGSPLWVPLVGVLFFGSWAAGWVVSCCVGVGSLEEFVEKKKMFHHCSVDVGGLHVVN